MYTYTVKSPAGGKLSWHSVDFPPDILGQRFSSEFFFSTLHDTRFIDIRNACEKYRTLLLLLIRTIDTRVLVYLVYLYNIKLLLLLYRRKLASFRSLIRCSKLKIILGLFNALNNRRARLRDGTQYI